MATSVTPTSAPASTTAAGLQPQQISLTDFMELLSAQLQGQDPTQPVDPTQFVTQLAQFTQLDEVEQIYSLLQQYLSGTASGSSSSTSGTSG